MFEFRLEKPCNVKEESHCEILSYLRVELLICHAVVTKHAQIMAINFLLPLRHNNHTERSIFPEIVRF